MFKKREVKKRIAESEKELASLEQKQMRSQSALMQSYVIRQNPREEDVNYFKIYTKLIELERENLRQLKKKLEKLEKY